MHKKKIVYSGYINDCSPQQLEALERFRERVHAMGCTEPNYDDNYLLRFLRARKFDLEKTTEMWKHFIQWRKDKKVEEVRDYDFAELNQAKQFYPHAWFRTDKLGRPMFIERPGKVVLDKLNKVMTNERLEQHFIHDYERLMNEIFPACSKVRGEVISNTCYIMDLKGVSARMMSPKIWELLRIGVKIGQDYYPEIMGTMFIVNTPMFFHGAWTLIKGFIDEKTRKKIHILGSNFKKELLQYVDENELPDFLGGKVTEADYGMNLTNEQGPWIKANTNNVTMPGISPVGNIEVPTSSPSNRHSTEVKDGFDETYIDGINSNSLPALPKQYKSIDEIIDGDYIDIADELPVKQHIKHFRPRISSQFGAYV